MGKCTQCHGDGYFYVVRQGNPFLMGAIQAAANSVRIKCDCVAKPERK